MSATQLSSPPGLPAMKARPVKPKPRAHRLSAKRAGSLALLIVLLLVWEFGVKLFHVPKFLIPPASDVAIAMWRGLATAPWAKDGLWYHTGVTLVEILLGFFVGSGIGLALGVMLSQMPRVEAVLEPYVAGFQSLPKVAVAPIIVMWLGFGVGSKVAIVCLLTFFPVLVTSIAGFKAIDPDRIDLLRSLSATPWQIFRKAKFPSALPYIFAGLNMAAAFAVVGAIVGEFVGAQSGLGVLILQMDAQMDTGGSFAVFIVLSIIGIALTSLLRAVQRRVLHWMPEESAQRTVNA